MNAHGVIPALVAVALALAAPRPGEGQEGFFDGVKKVEEISTPGQLEWGPEISADGLELFYTVSLSSRYELWVATRESQGAPWTSKRPLDELNVPLPGTSLTGRMNPSLSRNGRDLYFCVSDYAPTVSALWIATRSGPGPGELFSEARPLDEINNDPLVQGMSLIGGSDISSDDRELFFSGMRARWSGAADLYVATREAAGGPFTTVKALSEINTATCDDIDPSISSDGLTLFWSDFDSPYCRGASSADIWMAARLGRNSPFGTPKNVGFPINTGIWETCPSISSDWPASPSELYFARMPGDAMSMDIYVATWHPDCNGNHVDDADEIATSDCNDNGVIDSCDIAFGTSTDVNSNGIPDSCEPDCDGGGVPDAYEIAQGTAKDCNTNGIPDSCDIRDGTSKDENSDGVPDECPGPGGLQRRGDMNQDGTLDISDAVSILGHLFLGTSPALPCDGGTASSPGAGARAVVDVNGDGQIDLSDPVSILGFLFLGAGPPDFGTGCVRIVGCPEKCR